MASSSPLVSVLVTARDNERHVGAALRSVMRQTLRSLEILVVDDGSRDSTAAVVKSLPDERLELTHHAESAGISVRRNELLERARGRYVAPLDADDVWFPERLERQVRLLEATPELDAAGSDVLVVDDTGRVGPYFRLPRSNAAVGWSCLFTSPLVHSASTIRASAFHAGVRYDPAYPLAQDYDLWVKLLRHGGAVNIPQPLSLYRVHPAQASQARAAERLVDQERIGQRAIEELGGGTRASALAWRLGAEVDVPDHELAEALEAYRDLFARFTTARRSERGFREAQRIAAVTLVRRAGLATGRLAWSLRRAALALDASVPLSAPAVRVSNLVAGRRHRAAATRVLSAVDGTCASSHDV